ncbi:MAG: hypothetical protein ACI4JJ_01915 [Huintestinicola sp.]
MTKCKNCGKLSRDDDFCNHCGSAVYPDNCSIHEGDCVKSPEIGEAQNMPSYTNARPSSKAKKKNNGCATAVVVFIIVCWILSKISDIYPLEEFFEQLADLFENTAV